MMILTVDRTSSTVTIDCQMTTASQHATMNRDQWLIDPSASSLHVPLGRKRQRSTESNTVKGRPSKFTSLGYRSITISCVFDINKRRSLFYSNLSFRRSKWPNQRLTKRVDNVGHWFNQSADKEVKQNRIHCPVLLSMMQVRFWAK